MIIRLILLIAFSPSLFFVQEKRWLQGELFSVNENNERITEANVTVSIKEAGNRDETNSYGLFRIFLPVSFKQGESITIIVDKPGWVIQYPLDGEIRVPDDVEKDFIRVRLMPLGSKLFWSQDRIEKFIVDLAEKSKQQVTFEGKPEDIDFGPYVEEWATQYGFSVHEAKVEIHKWNTEIVLEQRDSYKLGLAALAQKKFDRAGQLFQASAETEIMRLRETQRLKQALEEKERKLTEEIEGDVKRKPDGN